MRESVFTTQTPGSTDIFIAYNLGMKFQALRTGRITAIRFWKIAGDASIHTGRIWTSGGTSLVSVTFSGETASGWQEQALTTPLLIQANTTYIVSVNIENNQPYPFSRPGLASQITNGNLISVADGANGVFVEGAATAFPNLSFQNTNYFRDVVFVAPP